MDKTAAHYRFNDSKLVLQHHFQGYWATTEDGQEERQHQSPRCDTQPMREIAATGRAYINYAKFEEQTDSGVVYVTKMKENLNYEALVDCMHQNSQGLMEYREQVVVFRKGDINHIARIITYVDIKKGKRPKLVSLLTNDFDMPLETILPCNRDQRWQGRFYRSIP